MLSLIAAAGENNVIAYQGKLPWSIPDDSAYFENKVIGKTVICGRKTFSNATWMAEKCHVILVTHSTDLSIPNVIVCNSVQDALTKINPKEESFVVGGGEIFAQTIDLADTIYLTRVHKFFTGDTFFPVIKNELWNIVSQKDQTDYASGLEYSYMVYDKS